jgi:hypothetical protein
VEDIATNPEVEVETGISDGEAANSETEVTTDEPTLYGDDGESTASAPVDEEVEYEGTKYKVPKELKDALLRQSDYTRKTQEVAEQRKSVEVQQQQMQQQAQLQQVAFKEYATMVNADQQLEQYKALDWQALIDRDPVEAMKLDRQMRQLQDTRNTAQSRITQIQQASAIQAQQETAKRLEEGRAAVQRDIKDWSPELAQKLTDHGKSYGFTDNELSQVTDPRSVQILHDAYLYRQIMQKTKPQLVPKVEAKPVTKVSGNSVTTKDPTQMSDREFATYRKKQIALRGSR